MDPFALSPVLVERPWGGRRLERYGKALPPGLSIGESWEVADLPDGVAKGVSNPRSVVSTGPLAGITLGAVMRRHGRELLGEGRAVSGEFPLLVKLLDAREHLSVQVHPDAGYVSRHPGVRLKTESWYVMAADPGSVLYLDLARDVARADLEAAIGTARVVDLLRSVPAQVGAFHHLPAGLVHALGAGVMVAEAQTPSDTTFRIYDWSEEYGRTPREMHGPQALEAVVLGPEGAVSLPPAVGPGSRLLEANPHYRLVEHRGSQIVPAATGLRIHLVVEGTARVGDLRADTGTTVVVPASEPTPVDVADGGVVLEIELP